MKILIITTDIIPLPGVPTSGTALRTYGIAEGLKANGHNVTISIPKPAILGFEKSKPFSQIPEETKTALSKLKELSFDSENQEFIVSQINPDAIICGHWPAMILKRKTSRALIVDLAGPHLLERHYQGTKGHVDGVMQKLGIISAADYFIVSGKSQKEYFRSFITRAGHKDSEQKIAQVFMPLNPELPDRTKTSENYPAFIFGGVFLPWQDPSFGLETVANYLEKTDKGNLKLIGGKHPHYNVDGGSYQILFDKLSTNKQVTINPMLPYEDFIKEMLKADVAIDLMDWNLERQLAVTIRSTTYLWAGLPVIYNNFADLAEPITKYDAGWCVTPGDKNELQSVLEEISNNPGLVKQKSDSARKLAREVFSWDLAVKPILELLTQPMKPKEKIRDIIVDFETSNTLKFNNKPLRQYFTSRTSGLCEVACQFRNCTEQSVVNFKLSETDFPQSLKQKPIIQQIFQDLSTETKWLTVKFDPISTSAGKTYCLEITANESSQISCPVLYESTYPLLSLTHDQQPLKNRSLCIRTSSAVNN
jgi:glycosyltransferase involved in cell wall biosynthesis